MLVDYKLIQHYKKIWGLDISTNGWIKTFLMVLFLVSKNCVMVDI